MNRSVASVTGALSLLLVSCGGGPQPAEQAAPAAAAPAPAAAAPAPAGTGLAAGVYTPDQAVLGATEFTQNCAECHSRTEFAGEDFMFNWGGSTVGRLFRVISETMPENNPGGMSDPEYLSVVAYILELNDFPAGETALPADIDVLNGLRIER